MFSKLLSMLFSWWSPQTYVISPSYVVELLRLHNENRDSPLVIDVRLMSAAQKHADWMASRSSMSHRGEGFSSPGMRIKQAGYDWSAYGENVAYGQTSPASVMRVWLGSRGHRRNIKSTAYRHIGIGYSTSSKGVLYWCVTFGARGFGRHQWAEAEASPSFES